ncbi:hypothetical protein CA235_18830 [Sphingomonas sp. ABOLF]|nr:hypothetical protein CA235_18830 [Sphingomonas sp. ABOLF]
MGSGANNTARYLGSAFGFTVIAIIIGHAGTAGEQAGLLHAWSRAVIVTAALSVIGAALIVVLLSSRRKDTPLKHPVPHDLPDRRP